MIELIRVGEQVDFNRFIEETVHYEFNRDHTLRTKKHEHLNGVTSPMQLIISIVEFEGEKIIIDGNSRRFAWESRSLLRPLYVYLNTYTCETEEEIADVYKSFDSKSATSTAAETRLHVIRKERFEPVSPLCKNASWLGAAKIFARTTDDITALTLSYPVLEVIDNMLFVTKGQRAKKWSTGVRAAMLITFQRDPGKSEIFWSKYNEDNQEAMYGMLFNITRDAETSSTPAAKALCKTILEIFDNMGYNL